MQVAMRLFCVMKHFWLKVAFITVITHGFLRIIDEVLIFPFKGFVFTRQLITLFVLFLSTTLFSLNHFGDDSNPITIKLNEFAEQLQCRVHSAFDNACCVTWQISGPCVFGDDIFADDEGNTNLCVRTSIDVLGIDSRNNRHDVVVGISPYISWYTSIKAGFIRHVMIAKRLFFTDDDNSCRRYANHAARFIEKGLEIARHLSGRTKSVYMCAFGIDPPFDDKKKLLYALFAVPGENMILTYQIGRDGLIKNNNNYIFKKIINQLY